MIENEIGRLSDRFPKELLDNVMLLPNDISSLSLLVLQSMYDLTFNAYYALNPSIMSNDTHDIKSCTVRSVESLLENNYGDKYDRDKIYDELQNSTNSTMEAAKTDSHSKYPHKKIQPGQASPKKSVFDNIELLYTEDMIKYIIYTVIENAAGPIDFSEELIAFNTFDGYDRTRNYGEEPPHGSDEQEIVDGVQDLLQRFSFKNKPMSMKARDQYLNDCCMFIDLILNYVVRELEICDSLTPLGHIEYPDKPEMTKLYLLNMQYAPDNSATGFSKVMSYGALPHKSILEMNSGEYSKIFGNYLVLTEIVDYKLNKSTGADVYIHCILLVEKLTLEGLDVCSLEPFTFKGTTYYKTYELRLELDYATYLQLFLNANYNKYLENIMSIILTHGANPETVSTADKKAIDVIKTLLATVEGGRTGGDE